MHLRRAAALAIFPYFSKVQWNILQNLLSFRDVDCGRTTKKMVWDLLTDFLPSFSPLVVGMIS